MDQQTTETSTTGLACYMRVSSDQQKAQGTVENQRTQLDRYTRAHDITPFGWYQDEAWSGTVRFADRPDAARLLADVRSGQVTTVLVTKLDRFGRNAREILIAVHDLNTAGAQLVSLKENVDSRTSSGRFFLTVLAGVAELERDVIVERTDAGKERRLVGTADKPANAWMGGHPPYGFRVEGKRQTATLVFDEMPDDSGYSELDVARLAWSLLLVQDWSCKRIAEYLAAQGIPTRHDRAPWTPATIYGILSNTVYMGTLTYCANDGQTYTCSVPALVSPAEWERGQQALERHRKTSTCNPARPYLLRGMLHCGLCHAPYTTTWRRVHGGEPGAIRRLYICSNHHYKGQHSRTRAGSSLPSDCASMWVDADWIENLVWTDIEKFARDPGTTLLELAAQAGQQGAAAETHRTALAELTQSLDSKQSERDRVAALFRKGLLSERDVERQLADIAREEQDLTRRRDSLTSALVDATAQAEYLERARVLLQSLRASLEDGVTFAKQRDAVEKFVRGITVETITTTDGTKDRRGRPRRRVRVTACYASEDPAKTPAAGVSAPSELRASVLTSREGTRVAHLERTYAA